MKRKNRLPELLAPAGDFECLVAAVRGGADAVYLGGKAFGARAYAKNFDIDELKRAVAYCHLHHVKLYVTVNTLLYDGELESAVEFAALLYQIGVDALIIADLGLLSEIRKRVPDMELHASTQMSLHNTLGADEAYALGCSRVVLARELSAENIKDVTARCRAEVEVFVHGALCVCHSGQCLFSSMVGGRSGNRGECAQPCRLPYNGGGYPLSLSDLSLANHMRELCDCGVSSLKIEGRMKSPDYVYTVTSIYRRLLDEYRNSTEEENRRLARAFSRGGFTDGYFTGDVFSKNMLGIRSEDDKQATKSAENCVYTPTRVRIFADATLKLGEPARLSFRTEDGRYVEVRGDVPEAARSAPLSEGEVKARIAKMGATFFSLVEDDVSLALDEGINLSPASINSLRRCAVEALEQYGYESRGLYTPIPPQPKPARTDVAHVKTALFLDPTSLVSALKDGGVQSFFDIIFLPLARLGELDLPVKSTASLGVYLPPVIMEDRLDEIRRMLEEAKNSGASYALAGNLGHLQLCREYGLTPIGDIRLNAANQKTREVYADIGIQSLIASAELNLPASAKIGGAVVYGRLPLMLTERCFMKDNFGCKSCSCCRLTDRKGVKFPIIREYEHRNLIMNSAITYMGDKTDELKRAGLGIYHYIFSTERPSEIIAAVAAFKGARPLPGSAPIRRIGKRESAKK